MKIKGKTNTNPNSISYHSQISGSELEDSSALPDSRPEIILRWYCNNHAQDSNFIPSFFTSEIFPATSSSQKPIVVCNQRSPQLIKSNTVAGKITKKACKTEHHLWNKRDSAASGQKALNLVRIVCGLPNEKEAIYGALDKWAAWETEFPVIAVAKALKILKKRQQWKRVIQVAKWMFGKGQGMTMGTFDSLLLAFDMDQRVDEAQSFWNMILHTHQRSISRRLFSRMISLYAHHNMPQCIIEVFADMDELGVMPDEDTVRKVARAFKSVNETEKQRLVLEKYLSEWKYIHFKGERVRVRRKYSLNDD